MINAFEVVTNRRIIYGENKINEIAGILKWYGKKESIFLHLQHRGRAV